MVTGAGATGTGAVGVVGLTGAAVVPGAGTGPGTGAGFAEKTNCASKIQSNFNGESTPKNHVFPVKMQRKNVIKFAVTFQMERYREYV